MIRVHELRIESSNDTCGCTVMLEKEQLFFLPCGNPEHDIQANCDDLTSRLRMWVVSRMDSGVLPTPKVKPQMW
jgi:hypothetical protein